MLTYREDIIRTSAGIFYIKASDEFARAIERTGATEAELRPIDPREHSKDQHGKVFALCREIARHWGYLPEEMRGILQDKFCEDKWLDPFSMSNVDMDTCSAFIAFLIDHCLEYGVPTKYPLGQYADDIEKYLRACLLRKKCALCGKPADIHHLDAIGMGRNRTEVIHVGMRAISLCRDHHGEAHWRGVKTFLDLYHLPRGIKLDEYLCEKLGLNTENKHLNGGK